MIIAPRSQHPVGRPGLRGAFEALILALLAYIVIVGLAGTARAVDVVPTNEVLQIEVQKGTIIRVGRPAATVFVADPNVADVESRSQKTVFVYGKRSGETTLYALDAQDRAILTVTVRVTHNLSRLSGMLRSVSPDADISLTSFDGGLVVAGAVEDPDEVAAIVDVARGFIGDSEQLINQIAVTAPTQVNLRVRFAEVSKDVVRLLGVRWFVDDLTGKTKYTFTSPRPDFSLDGDPTNAAFQQTIGPVNVEAQLDALESENLISLLAEPNLTALSGETASFLAGGEFPVPVSVDDNEVGIEFKEFGVRLAFTPTVLSGNRISLKVRPEVSQLTDQGAIILSNIQIPALTTRRAETTVELASGESFAIAGLIQNQDTHDINKVPGLGDVPILGKLFQSKRFQLQETELVIIATPYLVKPIGRGLRPSVPTDRPSADRQFERLLNERIAGDSGTAVSGDRLSGPVGFIVD